MRRKGEPRDFFSLRGGGTGTYFSVLGGDPETNAREKNTDIIVLETMRGEP
jgi:hypothetical protein